MRLRDLLKALESLGFVLVRQGKHQVWSNGIISLAIPHTSEVNRFTAKKILKQAGFKS